MDTAWTSRSGIEDGEQRKLHSDPYCRLAQTLEVFPVLYSL